MSRVKEIWRGLELSKGILEWDYLLSFESSWRIGVELKKGFVVRIFNLRSDKMIVMVIRCIYLKERIKIDFEWINNHCKKILNPTNNHFQAQFNFSWKFNNRTLQWWDFKPSKLFLRHFWGFWKSFLHRKRWLKIRI